jgi:fused signal recognition particle receptor
MEIAMKKPIWALFQRTEEAKPAEIVEVKNSEDQRIDALEEKKSNRFFSKLKNGLSKSSDKLGGGITGIFTRRKLDATSIEELEELLIEADLGAKVASELTAALAKQRFEKDIAAEDVRQVLSDEIAKILTPLAVPLIPDPTRKPAVIIMVGVNGNGKTTTIGKLASQFRGQGLSVMLAAADTFRAAAVEQLQQWGERAAVPVITGEPQSDPASVAFRAYERAIAEKTDVLLIDTAGRLQNKANLMAELLKIFKVLRKLDESAPHHIIQVLDATTGQNALSQVQVFKEMANVTGLIVTKLDGTAKGGIVVALARQFALPIHAVGVGEGIDDLNAFDAADFAHNLLDLNDIG